MSRNLLTSFLITLLLLCSNSKSDGEITIESSFNPTTITSSRTSTYKVIVHGSQQGPVGSMPSVKGLRFSSPPHTLRSASFINGVPSVRFELSFTVTPEKQGTFVIPAWPIKVENNSYLVPESVLKVLPPNQQDRIREAEQRQQEQDLRQAAFLEFNTPRPYLFKGETVNAKISLYLWDRLPVTRIEQVPIKMGSGFSMTELGQPIEQRNVIKFNKTYSVYSWDFGLTGTIPGQHTISFDSTIRVRVRNNRNSPFSGPFFNDPFFGFGREDGLKISSDPINLEIRPLPTLNRPDNFQGAIGDLSITNIADSDRVSVGDPIRLICKISGSGNFGAMPAPNLSFGEQFKVGPPAFSFEGNENTKQQGTQSFEFIITPLQAGLIEIPPISFSYFNPEEEKYYSLVTNSHSLRVDPGEKWLAPDISASNMARQPVTKSTQDLLQTESEPGRWINVLATPTPHKSIIFWLCQLLPLGILIGLIIYRFKRRNPREEARRMREKQLESKAKDALRHKDISGLHQATRRRIRLRVGIACNRANTSALSSSEIISLLNRKGYSKEIVSEIIEILKTCDELEYAGEASRSSNIESTFQRSQAILKKLK